MKRESPNSSTSPLIAGNNSQNSADHNTDSGSLRQAVERAMERYFQDMGNEDLVRNLYDVVLSEVEAPLLQAVLKNTDGNQSKASTMLGLNRGTLRKKMKQYGLL